MASSDDLRVAAVVAAAGMSQRMGTPKQLLDWQGRPVIVAVVENLVAAKADPVLCVLGHRAAAVRRALGVTSAHTVINPRYREGDLLLSFQCGLKKLTELSPKVAGALLALGDQPQIPAEVHAQILEQARARPAHIVIPSVQGRCGHPVYCPRHLWTRLLALPPGETLRSFLGFYRSRVRSLEVASEEILYDLDFPADYDRARARWNQKVSRSTRIS